MGHCHALWTVVMMAGFFSIFIFALCTSAQLLPSDPQGCAGGSCYPSTGNLLIGRAANLTATSTCGLQGPETYCIVSHLQEADKCFLCDSRRPYDPDDNRNSHRIENIIYHSDHNDHATWWQAESGVEKVNIQLNLEAQFHFTHLIMKFKTFRPAAMMIERSADFGRSWKPYRYFAHNCARAFPSIPARPLQRSDDIICEERYSDIEPSTGGEVIYKVLDPAIDVKDPYSPQIQDLLRITNLRVNFSGLHTLGDSLLDHRPEVLQKYYYALHQLLVRGSCFCYGHASRCAPAHTAAHTAAQADSHSTEPGMIHGHCACEHNTAGLNCERCLDFHHDLPWSPAERDDPHTCRECNCNGHTSQCHFDMAVYLASGNLSGGVCDSCLHNTMGRNCETCLPFYYQHPARDIRDPAACVSCDCDPAGTLEGGICDSHTDPSLGMIAGQCRCKPNVRGERCDSCRDGFFSLDPSDPLGCQPCQCDLRGSISMRGESCDPISGECFCKRRVTGIRCDQCLPEFWGLSLDVSGCRECDCDFGGAYGNRCMPDSGQCDCRPHLGGRQCSEVQPGYFSAPLDFYRYEAESATGHTSSSPAIPGQPRPPAQTGCDGPLTNQLLRRRRNSTEEQQGAPTRHLCPLQQTPDVQIVHREPLPDQKDPWGGLGFARVRDGAGLIFTIDNIPFAMEYDIMLRYEPEPRPLAPQAGEDWEALIRISSLLLSSSQRCGNVLPTEQMYRVTLPHQKRYVQTDRSFCFEPQNKYVVAVRLQRNGVPLRDLSAHLLADSLVLIPKYTELPGFQGNSREAEQRRQDMLHYMCLDSFMATPMATPTLAPTCASLVHSISAIMHDGALPCLCDPQGSLSTECAGVGGQCQCKAGVAGRHCDRCAPGAFGFGPQGCTACECNPQGSEGSLCDPVSGQCLCQEGASGRRCDSCLPGQWGFPNCRPCQCNGHSDTCHPHTGTCLDCRDHTAGHLCDRCVDGFYGNPLLGSGKHCRPCACPGQPGTGHSNADSCSIEPTFDHITCHCREGYTGLRCDRCAPGYFGDPERPGGRCHPCHCSGNIDPQDPESCDPRTGRCLRCLHNTDGPHCSVCRLGYYGNALEQNCRRCACVLEGTVPSRCNGALCHCQERTGACPCRGNVVGLRCDRCAPQHWNFGAEQGCEPCACHPQSSTGPHCNMTSGACECQPGFGGRTCSECEKNHWGDPHSQCKACDCDPLGSESLQCDRATGACRCREGVVGRRCDRCSRGFTEGFPRCVRCCPCFSKWDVEVRQLQWDLQSAQRSAKSVMESRARPTTGHAHLSHTHISHAHARGLQSSLAQIQGLIQGAPAGGVHQGEYQRLRDSTDDLRAEIAMTDRQVEGVQREIPRTAERDRAAQQKLSQTEKELRDTNALLAQRRLQLHSTASAGLLASMWGWSQASLESERMCLALWGANGPIRASHDARSRVETLLLDWGAVLQRRALSQRRLQWMKNKMCGDNGRGDGGCRVDQGRRLCGGKGCAHMLNGSALQRVANVSAHLTYTSKQLHGAAQKLQDADALARGVKSRAAGSLLRAKEKTDFTKKSNKELRDLLQRIRSFLTDDSADPGAVGLVSQQVLLISLPVNGSDLARMLQDIQHSLANLSSSHRDDSHSALLSQRTQELLLLARDTQTRAARTWVTANQTRQLLDATQAAVRTTEEALEPDHSSVRRATAAVVERMGTLENKQTDAALRVASVRQGAESLQRKLNDNRAMAQSARAQADGTAQAAKGLDQELEKAQAKWRELEGKVGSLGGGAQSLGAATERARSIQRQAQDVLRKATESMETLHRLERRFRENERRLQGQKEELAELERNVTAVRDFIQESVLKFTSC